MASLTAAIAGLMVAIVGITAGPLIVVTGIMLALYGGLNLHRLIYGHSVEGDTHVAVVCQRANHAGCQDDPGCTCGCHAERIDYKMTG